MNLKGLSFDNIPEFSTPFRFFVTAPVLGLLGCLLLVVPEIWISRWQPQLIAMTHLFTLGFIAMIMFGALTQILPVLAGTGLPKVDKVAPILHVCLVLGVVLFPLNFLYPSSLVLAISLTPLLIAIGLFVTLIGWVVIKKNTGNYSIRAVRFAVFSLVVTVITGCLQLFGYFVPDVLGSGLGKSLTNLHLTWGLLGWVTVLIMGVSFQVIPMFHVTPDFHLQIKKWLPATQFALLVILSFSVLFQYRGFSEFVLALLGVCMVVYAIYSLRLLNNRKRKVPDTTINFWFLSFVALIASMVAFLCASFINTQWQAELQLFAVTVFIAGFVISVIFGMLIKIIPFLAYLHLQQRAMKCFQAMSALPNMHDLLPVVYGQNLFKTYLILLPVVCLVPFLHSLSPVVGVLMIATFLQLLFIQLKTWSAYQEAMGQIEVLIKEHGEMDLTGL
ncbi:hypothetical protein [Litoribacillus peritrichatus]|uniref:Permease n=1 Tax=Litoribacillus peritrichatus TaxID=718191 RepID=A0ABP7MC44_9GAMM